MDKSFSKSCRGKIWPGWFLILCALLFTFASSGFLVAQKIWRWGRRRASILFAIFVCLLLGLYILLIFKLSLVWYLSLAIQLGLCLFMGLGIVIIQRNLASRWLQEKEIERIWEIGGLRKRDTTGGLILSILPAGLLFYGLGLLCLLPGTIITKTAQFQKMYVSLPPAILLWALPSFAYGLACGLFWYGRQGRVPVSRLISALVGFFSIGILASIFIVPITILLGKGAIRFDTIQFLDDCRLQPWFHWTSCSLFFAPFLGYILYVSEAKSIGKFFQRHLTIALFLLLALIHSCLLDFDHVRLCRFLGWRHAVSIEAESPHRAVNYLGRVVSVFPQNVERAKILLEVANQYYLSGKREKATDTYRFLIDSCKDDPRYLFYVKEAKVILKQMESASPEDERFQIEDVPPIEKAEYLTQNWQSFLTALRFWEKEIPAEKFKIRLQEVSKKEDEIELPPLFHVAQLKEFGRELGYKVYFTTGSLEELKKILKQGQIPLVKLEGRLYPVVGYDEIKGTLIYFDYSRMKEKKGWWTKHTEAREIVYGKAEKDEELTRREARKRRQELRTELSEEEFGRRWKESGQIICLCFPEDQEAGQNKSRLELTQAKAYDYQVAATFRLREKGNLSPMNLEVLTEAISQFSLGGIYLGQGARTMALKHFLQVWNRRSELPCLPIYIHLARLNLEKPRYNPLLQERFGIDLDRIEFGEFSSSLEVKKVLAECARRFEDSYRRGELTATMLESYCASFNARFPENYPTLREIYRRLVRLHPDRSRYYENLVKLHQLTGNIEEEITELEALVALRPRKAGYQLSLAYALTKEDHLEEVEAQLARVSLRRNKSNWENLTKQEYYKSMYHYLTGWAKHRRGNLRSASRHLRRAIRINALDGRFHYELACVLLNKGHASEAEKELKLTLLLAPEEEILEDVKDKLRNINRE